MQVIKLLWDLSEKRAGSKGGKTRGEGRGGGVWVRVREDVPQSETNGKQQCAQQSKLGSPWGPDAQEETPCRRQSLAEVAHGSEPGPPQDSDWKGRERRGDEDGERISCRLLAERAPAGQKKRR